MMLAGVVSRLERQKGLDILYNAMPEHLGGFRPWSHGERERERSDGLASDS